MPHDISPYDAFAWFYQRYWNEEFHGRAFPVLERLLLSRLPAGARILDVCCGTGYLAALLAGRGFSVAGVDASPEMIRYARETAPGAEFHAAKASDFHLPNRFAAAVSTFDSLNHILEPAELARAFAKVAAALEPGGLFVFDMLMEDAYQTHWGENFLIVRDDHLLAISGGGYDAERRLAHCRITMFRLLDGWQRADSLVQERCYSSQDISAALEQAGFGTITCYDARDLGMHGDLGEGRVFFVAQRI
jgi:SAM-dependent methyltransferase